MASQQPDGTSKNSRDGTFGWSRIAFWFLALLVFVLIVVTPFHQGKWSASTVIVLAGVDALGILLLLALYRPRSFHWAGRAASGLVFLAYFVYLIDEVTSRGSWHFGFRSETNSLDALLGLLVVGVPCLRYMLVGRLGTKRQIRSGDIENHRWLNGQCTECSKPLSEHDWAGFACTVANEKNKKRLTDFFDRVHEHDWRSVAKFQEYDPTQNDMLVYAVRCAAGGLVFVVQSPFEPWEDDELRLCEVVTAEEMKEIEGYIEPDTWRVAASA